MQNTKIWEFNTNRRRTICFQVLSALDDIPKIKNYCRDLKTAKMQGKKRNQHWMESVLSQILPRPMFPTGLKCSLFHTFRSPCGLGIKEHTSALLQLRHPQGHPLCHSKASIQLSMGVLALCRSFALDAFTRKAPFRFLIGSIARKMPSC